jgi:L-2,4-diaminobutyrate decarboxylase
MGEIQGKGRQGCRHGEDSARSQPGCRPCPGPGQNDLTASFPALILPLASALPAPWPTPLTPQDRGSGALPLFAPPNGLDPRLETFLQQASSLLCSWLGQTQNRGPLPALSVLPSVEPELSGLGGDRLLADLQLVMEGAFHPGHPGALAHLDPPALTASIAADLICAGLNNNLLAEELAPSLSHLERGLCGWFAAALGLGEASGGVAASGGSLSNLMALVTARRSRGLGQCGEAVVLCSVDAHVSLVKALSVMGLHPEALIRLPVDASGGLCSDQLSAELERLERAGIPVIAVVATAGTTVRGAIDPLEAIAGLCRRHGVWLHVDAAIGGVFALVPQLRSLLAGLEQADSVTVNPQKLLGITKTSSLLLLAEPQRLQQAFGTGLPYMEPSWGGGHGGEMGLQGSRPAEILKLWLGLRQLGLEGITALVEAAILRRQQLQGLLAQDERLQLLAGPLHLLAFRPRCGSAAALAQWSEQTRAALLAEQLMLSRPFYGGFHHLKAVLGNPHTQACQLQRLAAIVASQPCP